MRTPYWKDSSQPEEVGGDTWATHRAGWAIDVDRGSYVAQITKFDNSDRPSRVTSWIPARAQAQRL